GAGARGRGSSMEWRVHRVGGESVDRVADLIAASLPGGWGHSSVASALDQTGSFARWVLDEEGRAVGVVLARRILDGLEIDQVGVLPSARRQGAARALMTRLLDENREAGLIEALLELAESNLPARALYAGLGFVVVGRRARYYPGGDDALLLRCTLRATGSASGR
ncbi:MAG: GNAT family N-acetyltransferase, partial [bacterium]